VGLARQIAHNEAKHPFTTRLRRRLAKSKLPVVFQETRHEGCVLNLSIMQRLVKLLNDRRGLGRESKFALMRAALHSKARREAHAGLRVSEPQARILLVGDDAAGLNVIRILLRSEGYQVTTVLSTANALRQAAADPRIDLLVTAYLLGTETGIQVIAALRRLLGRPLKAVLIRGETLSALAELPADPLVRLANKPVNAEQLLSLVAGLLDHAPDSSGGWSVELHKE